MSSWERLGDIGCVVAPICPEYVDSLWGAFLVLADFFPVTITLIFFGASLIRAEFVLFYISLGLTVDYWLNYALRAAIGDPPPTPGCGEAGEMPALATQHAVFITAMALLVICRWRVYFSEWKTFVLFAFVSIVTYARVYIGYNTPAQLLVGAAVGLAHALCWFALFHWLLAPRVERVIRWPLVRWGGFKNTVCN